MAEDEEGKVSYPLEAKSYRLLHEIGSGVSAVVYKAACLPLGSTVVAIKSIDLERSKASLEDVRREAKAMALLSHPNVLRAHCSFTVGRRLWVVMPFMAAGSLQSIISSAYPHGLPEPAIALVLRAALLALSYLHSQGHIHRDIKAGNILAHSDGSVRLADFGVSASIYDSAAPSLSLCTDLAGTPYWMAPEVLHSRAGYGVKADVWSLGITALELAHGRPPLSHLPLSNSLMMKITRRLRLDDDALSGDTATNKRKKKFSKAFKEMVASCLAHDPAKRPSADKLLRHPFFKNCRSADYFVRNILQAVPPIEETAGCGRRRCPDESGRDGSLSPVERCRRISGWNFNEDALKMDPVYPTESEEVTGNCEKQEEDHKEYGGKDTVVVVSKEMLLPNLMSLLSSLDAQREMVKNVLSFCGGGGDDAEAEENLREVRERQLLSLIESLQVTVDELNLQLKREMQRNAQLEETLQSLRGN